jgi:hypothetical protein
MMCAVLATLGVPWEPAVCRLWTGAGGRQHPVDNLRPLDNRALEGAMSQLGL